jgi:hypothetical protein
MSALVQMCQSGDNNNIFKAGRVSTFLVTSVNRIKDEVISIKILSFA